ncbi:transcriptional regulator [Chloroflexales bacterium ZM16-3]|nr:transcriptional regulator [Chloroflexales bacterium ZM16-3]
MDLRTQHSGWSARRRLIAVLALAILLRAWAALLLPVDFDEPTYVRAALGYARALRAGDLGAVIDSSANSEHPPLVKLLYAGGALALGDAANSTSVIYSSRAISALAGVLAVAALAWYAGPLAAGLLAVHTLAVKYTSQAYLEAVPLAWSIIAVGAAARACGPRAAPASRRQLWLSAFALGLTAAGKLDYLIVAPAIVAIMLTGRRPTWRGLTGYLLLAALTFWAFTPTLWRDPLGRLAAMGAFHLAYSHGADVAAASYPWFQPLIWLGSSAAADWHPEVFFYFGFDGPIFLLALAGLPLAWRAPGRRWQVIWLLLGLLILLIWPTKWPQYALPLVPAVCILAAPALAQGVTRLRDLNDYWGWAAEMLPRPPRYAWVAMGLMGLFVLGVYAYGLISIALGSVGWTQLTASDSPLLGGPVAAALALPDGRVALAGGRGAQIWQDGAAGEQPVWRELTHAPTLAMAMDASGGLWLGGEAGLFSGASGRLVYDAADFGGGSSIVYALAVGSDGRLWVGTGAGAAVRSADGARWEALPQAAGGGAVLAITVERRAAGDVIWFGGMGAVRQLDTASDAWRSFGGADGFAGTGVSALLADSRGQIWAATLGDGLGMWDGASWSWHTVAGGELPYGTVTALHEGPPGTLWVGTAEAFTKGGALTRYDGDSWQTYLPRNSGFRGAEPLAICTDARGRLWVATRSDGVFLYQQNP